MAMTNKKLTKGKGMARLRRRQLDRNLQPFSHLATTPSHGWLREIRAALGMTGQDLAARLGVRPATVVDLEASEARLSISLKTLAKAASALNCRLVYALVPNDGSLEEILQAQARRVAERMVSKVSHSMSLEAQGVDVSFREQEVRDLTDELVRTLPRGLWKPIA